MSYIGRGPGVVAGFVPRGYIDGLIMSTAGASTSLTVGIGSATDSTRARVLELVAAIAKTTGAWAVGSGNGGLDTGAIAANTWYHVHLIQRPDTGVVDVLFSLSLGAPTMPANYLYRRRIGSWKTNASSQWYLVQQWGDEFHWIDAVTPDFDAALTISVPQTFTCINAPPGVIVRVFWRGSQGVTSSNGSGNLRVYAVGQSDVSPGDLAPNADTGFIYNYVANIIARVVGNGWALTNTSAQLRIQNNLSGSASAKVWAWIDQRGKDA